MLYFVDSPKPLPQVAKKLLPGRGEELPVVNRQCTTGPGGKPGFVFAFGDDGGVAYLPDQQEWHLMPRQDGKEVYCGWRKDKPPEPEDLQRSEILAGHRVELAGRQWIIPQLREWTIDNGGIITMSSLPTNAVYTVDGWIAGEVIEKYRELYRIGDEVYQTFIAWWNQEEKKLPEDCFEMAVKLLCVNYRITASEISAMQLLQYNVDCVWEILRRAIDEPTAMEMIKKKAALESD